jgi:GNAT superfamily N-acetyltransferase
VSASDPVIECLEEGRIEEAGALIRRTLTASNSRDYAPEVIRNLHELYSAEHLRELMRERDMFVLIEEDQVVATAGLERDTVCAVFVEPARQRGGFGAMLMRHLEALARSRGITVLTVPASITAEGFYGRLGYVAAGALEDPRYGRVILMQKSLEP